MMEGQKCIECECADDDHQEPLHAQFWGRPPTVADPATKHQTTAVTPGMDVRVVLQLCHKLETAFGMCGATNKFPRY